MLYIKVNIAEQLRQNFIAYNRYHYSLEACKAIIKYYYSIEDNMLLDINDLSNEFSEDSTDYIISNYDIEIEDTEDEDNKEKEAINYLQKHSWAVKTVDDKILYIVF
jgi:hypothetical protein